MRTHVDTMTVEEIIEGKAISSLPIEIIPNNMGINLCCVENIQCERVDNGSLVSVKINFKQPCYENTDGCWNEKNL